MHSELFNQLMIIAQEKKIPMERLLRTLEDSLTVAYRRHYDPPTPVSIRCQMSESNDFTITAGLVVVEIVANRSHEVEFMRARRHQEDCELGDVAFIPVNLEEFGRIAATTMRQSLQQIIRQAEEDMKVEHFRERVGEIVNAKLMRRERDSFIFDLGDVDGVLTKEEQVPTENYSMHTNMRVYLLEAKKESKGAVVYLSRSHPALIRKLFELNVPEIRDGDVEIKSVAREPGARTKISVISYSNSIDPVGACVGQRGMRVQAVVDEVHDEKIDIIRWSDDPVQYIAESLNPAKVSLVRVLSVENKLALVVVPDNQLSLAIGKQGQNVRLAARLTGWKIDIRSHTQIAEISEG
ncbi:MAG: transcription termination factor NusA [Armatimonadota bacterium]